MSLNNKNWIVRMKRIEFIERELSAPNEEEAQELAQMSARVTHENATIQVTSIKEDTRGKEFPM